MVCPILPRMDPSAHVKVTLPLKLYSMDSRYFYCACTTIKETKIKFTCSRFYLQHVTILFSTHNRLCKSASDIAEQKFAFYSVQATSDLIAFGLQRKKTIGYVLSSELWENFTGALCTCILLSMLVYPDFY